jgi:2-hydroxy-3-keto-5-methylthiopentenyl-1-phosphate phosphatase
VHIFCDFDGTISREDVTDIVLDLCADPAWRIVEAEWQAGSIGSRDCLARQVALLRCDEEELDGIADGAEIDPSFSAFAAYCAARSIPLTIVSDGFGRLIHRILTREGLGHLPVMANRLVAAGPGRWVLDTPHGSRTCEASAGTCKCAVAAREGTRPVVLVGDGQSDACLAEKADFVISKSRLADFCAAKRLPHAVFASFRDVLDCLGALSWPAEAIVDGTSEAMCK